MASQRNKDESIARRHHQKSKFCHDRPAYREARWERAVKVYTINQESKFLLVQGVPSVGVTKELIELFAIYGPIEEYRYLHEYPAEEFTDVYWIKFQKIQSARFAKKKLDMRSFYGGILHVCYAPEYETIDDTREKLNERRRLVARKCKEYYPKQEIKPHQKLPDTNRRTEVNFATLSETPKDEARANATGAFQMLSSPAQVELCPAMDCRMPQQTDSQFPQLPLPPVPLPFHLYPPPPPPPPSDFPRVPTKDATLPAGLRHACEINARNASVAKTQSTPAVTVNALGRTSAEAPETRKRPLETNSAVSLKETQQKEKRIVWHSLPGPASYSPNLQNLNRPEPGAWDPYAERRKELKSLTGDQKLDEVAMKIRQKVRKMGEVDSNTKDDRIKDGTFLTDEVPKSRKKGRKRI